jgi:hypothetical protein
VPARGAKHLLTSLKKTSILEGVISMRTDVVTVELSSSSGSQPALP